MRLLVLHALCGKTVARSSFGTADDNQRRWVEIQTTEGLLLTITITKDRITQAEITTVALAPKEPV